MENERVWRPRMESERVWRPRMEIERVWRPRMESERVWRPRMEIEKVWRPRTESERDWRPSTENERELRLRGQGKSAVCKNRITELQTLDSPVNFGPGEEVPHLGSGAAHRPATSGTGIFIRNGLIYMFIKCKNFCTIRKAL